MATPRPAPATRDQPVRLLVIEDNPGDVGLIRHALGPDAECSFAIDSVAQLREGCGCLLRNTYDLVLLDLSLPDAQGVEGVRWIRGMADTLPILVLTGNDDERVAVAATQMGAEDYIVKDQSDPRALRRTILQVLERHRLRTELELAVRRADHLATHDMLTSLPNRQRFHEELDNAIARAERYGHGLAVMLMDLDGFKAINDRLGHAAGDHMLWTVANRLSNTVRKSDTVARLGGDEFTVLLPVLQSSWEATRTAEKILRVLSKPIELDGTRVCAHTSIGVALYPSDGRTARALLKAADLAMYDAKGRRGDSYHFFQPESQARDAASRRLEDDLKSAIDHDEFRIQYQPQVDVERGELCGAEALLRWRREDGSVLSPSEFLPAAEELGLADRLGGWVIDTACSQLRDWGARSLPPLRIAVNLFPSQYRSESFAEGLTQTLAEMGVDPRLVELEIAETYLGSDVNVARDSLAKLKEANVGITIDDIGGGHTSIRSISTLPVDQLKLGRELVSRLHTKEEQSIAAALVSVAHGTGREVIAVGVETEEQMDILRAHRCSRQQGLLFGPALDANQLEALMLAGSAWKDGWRRA